MTFPITPDPNIHTQPAGIRQQKSLYTGGQLATWRQSLPQAMTKDLCIAILEAIGVSPGAAEQLWDQVQSELATWNTISNNAHAWATRLTNDLTILLDVFHGTYQAGSTGDPPGTLGTNGKPTWYSAWNDLLALLGIVNSTTTPSNPAPTIGTAITTAQTTANNGTSWSTRITNDLLILLDVFHATYQAGSAGDPPGTLGTNGKPTWYSAWNDMLALFGIVNNTSTSTNPAPTIGSAITTAQSTATTANSNATTAQSWGTRLTNDLLILSDVFHLTYQAGSTGDAPGTLGTNGKPTWYSAWNDLLALCGIVNSTTAPTDAAPTTGTVIQANTATANTASTNASTAIANAQSITDGIYQAMNGGTSTGNPTSSIKPGLTAIPASNVVGNTGAAVAFGSVGAGNGATGVASSRTLTWTDTIATGDLGVLAFLSWQGLAGDTFTTSASYGGVAMTSLHRELSSSGACLEVFWLKTPPSGSQTVSVTAAGSSGVVQNVCGNSVSYSASKVVTTVGNNGGSTATPSMSASSATGHYVVGAFYCLYTGASITLSSFTQTQRGSTIGNSTPGPFILGDVTGASSVSFGVTASHSLTGWCGITVDLSN